MTGRRLPNSFATVATAGRGAEPPARPCAELDDDGRPMYAHLFDAVLDHKVGPNYRRAVRAARRVCETCPLAVKTACYAENKDHPGVIAGLTYQERLQASYQPCGTPAAYRRHKRHGTPACLPCGIAHAKWLAEKRAARAAA